MPSIRMTEVHWKKDEIMKVEYKYRIDRRKCAGSKMMAFPGNFIKTELSI